MCFRFLIHLSCYTSIFAILTNFGIIFDLENRRQAHLDLYRVIDCETETIVLSLQIRADFCKSFYKVIVFHYNKCVIRGNELYKREHARRGNPTAREVQNFLL